MDYKKVSVALLILFIASAATLSYMYITPPVQAPVTVTRTSTVTQTVGGTETAVTPTVTKTVAGPTTTATVTATTTLVQTTTITAPTPTLTELAKKEGELTVIYVSSAYANLLKPFEQKYGIKTKAVKVQPSEVAPRLQTEYAAGRYEWDVVQNSYHYMVPISQTGYLTQYVPKEAKILPSKYIDPAGLWTGATFSVWGVVYNTDRVKAGELPATIEGFADPRWKGRLAFPDASVTATSYIVGLFQEFGDEKALGFLRSIFRNLKPTVHPDDGFLLELMVKGEVDVMVNGFPEQVLRKKTEGAHVDFAPDMKYGRGYGLGAIAIAREPPHLNAAKLFVEFTLSEEGQKILANVLPPVRPGIKSQAAVLTEKPENMFGVDPTYLLANIARVKGIWGDLKKEAGLG